MFSAETNPFPVYCLASLLELHTGSTLIEFSAYKGSAASESLISA